MLWPSGREFTWHAQGSGFQPLHHTTKIKKRESGGHVRGNADLKRVQETWELSEVGVVITSISMKINYFNTEFHCGLPQLGAHYVDWVGLEFTEISFLCLQRSESKGMYHTWQKQCLGGWGMGV